MKTDVNGIGEIHPHTFYWKQHPHGLTYQQYTGLKDKNGKEIYEGDILEIYQHNQPEEVSYVADGSTAFGFFKHDSIERTDGSFETLGDYTDSSGYKVIGNIFENPELLELKWETNNQSKLT